MRKGTMVSSVIIPDVPLTIGNLLAKSDGDNFAPLAIILREALNKRRLLPDGDTFIARIMGCIHPTTGKPIDNQDVDHFDPIRLDNNYSRMIRKHFTAARITSAFGLTNLLVWMSTGQGYLTRDFCAHTDLWFTTPTDCIETFKNANAGPFKSFNVRIWGQTCTSFRTESKRFTMEEKFVPFFHEKVLEKWKNFLGARFDSNDPDDTSQVRDDLPSYATARGMLKDLCAILKLNGFKDGLTSMQFANNLVALDLCHPPTIDELAEWIQKHPEKGAFKGLVLLGFQIENRPSNWVKAALQCVLDHLTATLATEDKYILRFGTIFVEHVLCKIGRFDYLITQACKRTTLCKLGMQAGGATWTAGANLLDKTGEVLPIPVKGDQERMKASVEVWA